MRRQAPQSLSGPISPWPFSASDIETIEALEGDRGLSYYSQLSRPLRYSFTIADLRYRRSARGGSARRNGNVVIFLDIFNQSLYDLLYQGWLKYRQFFNIAEAKNDALSGSGSIVYLDWEPNPCVVPRIFPARDYRLLRYIGLFTQKSPVGCRIGCHAQ